LIKKSPRAICLEILNRVEKSDSHLDRLLTDSFKRYRHLTPLDRAFLTELSYGVLRWRERLDWIISRFSKIPLEKIEKEVLNTLRLGLYQVFFLSKTPVSAAVNESVELAKKSRGAGGAGFVNGLLRSAIRKKEEITYPDILEDPALHISVLHSHPLWLVRRWIDEVGVEETLETCALNNRISSLTLRTNTLKTDRETLIGKLKMKGLMPSPARYSEEGVLLEDPPPVSELPFFSEGLYILQNEASQLVVSILDPRAGERVLDACAAPGGKTTHVAQKMKNEGEIYASDLTARKLGRVQEISRRLGIEIIKTVKADASKTLPLPTGIEFDRVLADVPCSGFGTLQRNPDLKWRRKEGDIARLSELQSSILRNVSSFVKREGTLVYSTCTVFREENEDVIGKFLIEHPEFYLDDIRKVLGEKCFPFIRDGFFQTFPRRDGMDGFFAARLVKSK